MSGIEIAGLVLGSFPILLNCLEYYHKGFEPLENYWNFRAYFIAFIDDIRHQMMKYNDNMTRLLDPIIADNESLNALVRNAKDPRWKDGSLDVPLEMRLASEHDRFLRIVERMEEVVESLKKFLRIEDSHVPERPWERHLKRVRFSFSKGKNKKVKRLETHNQELQEILGYSERIIPIAEKRKTSGPVAIFEKIHQNACYVHNALERHLKCHGGNCRSHHAHLSLRSETKLAALHVLFMLEGEQGSYPKSLKQEVVIQPAEVSVAAPPVIETEISYVQQAARFTAMQEETKIKGKRLSFSRLLSRSSETTKMQKSTPLGPAPSPAGGNNKLSPQLRKQAHFTTPTHAIANSVAHVQNPRITITDSSGLSFRHVADLCSSLRTCQESALGVIVDEFDRQFQLFKSPESGPVITAPDTARLISLPELLEAYHQASIDIARQRRFEMAAHIASGLLQIRKSPWLSRWSKHEFYFLADSQTIYSDYPYVSRSLSPRTADPSLPTTTIPVAPSPTVYDEENTRAALFTVGKIVLELIFGRNIESCDFRHEYYGPNNQPNDQTDIGTARKWAEKVLGECGVEIADVVGRCLNCAFGPRPNFQDERFREAVYEGVIKPLADYQKAWQVVMP